MLDLYDEKQIVAINFLKNAIKNDKISHAYLFETNGNCDSLNIAISFAKAIICPHHYTNNNQCSSCNICKRIDNSNYPEIKIIKPEGLWIKKEEIESLQEDFNKKGIESSKRIYIITECEKMNKQTANAILKFLEEPAENIIAILLTNNINMLLDTIVSRCQLIVLRNIETVECKTTIDKFINYVCKTEEEKKEWLSNKENYEIIDNVLDFIKFYELKKMDSIIYIKEMWHDKFDNREKVDIAIDLLIRFYYDVLRKKVGKESIFFIDKIELINTLSSSNKMESIIKKIEILIDNKEILKYNLNLNLFINKVLIELGGVHDGNCCS